MPSAVRLREDYRRRASTHAPVEGRQPERVFWRWRRFREWSRAAAAKIGGMIARRCATGLSKFNASGPEGLIDQPDGRSQASPVPRNESAQFAIIVEAGPDRKKDGIVRWRMRRSQACHCRKVRRRRRRDYVGKLLRSLAPHISARPRHPAQASGSSRGLKKLSRAR